MVACSIVLSFVVVVVDQPGRRVPPDSEPLAGSGPNPGPCLARTVPTQEPKNKPLFFLMNFQEGEDESRQEGYNEGNGLRRHPLENHF
ncbi:hypothetical protein EQG41_14370 [Billgrantia azerbaijanica]|nr:hypothetical protein EQG41_14370 [Halomonas azerbaijanica]